MRQTAEEVDRDRRERERCEAAMLHPRAVFVFGSNEAGSHGAGAARYACTHYGAAWGTGFGRSGRTFAIPTKDANIETRDLASIAHDVRHFLSHARENDRMRFVVTRIGCGLAGYTDEEIAPLFRDAPENCDLPEGWRQ